MNFIEKIMSVGKSTENTDTSTETPSQETQADTPDSTTNQQINGDTVADAEPKTYTEDEMSELLKSKKLEWHEEIKNKSESYINSLPEAERLKIQQLSKDEEIAGLKGELAKRDLEKVVIAKLDEERFPTSLAQLVQYSDEKSTMASLDVVIDLFQVALADAIKQRLRGKTPAGLGGAANCENSRVDPFSKTFDAAFKR